MPPFFSSGLPPAFAAQFQQIGSRNGKGLLPGPDLVPLHRIGPQGTQVSASRCLPPASWPCWASARASSRAPPSARPPRPGTVGAKACGPRHPTPRPGSRAPSGSSSAASSGGLGSRRALLAHRHPTPGQGVPCRGQGDRGSCAPDRAPSCSATGGDDGAPNPACVMAVQRAPHSTRPTEATGGQPGMGRGDCRQPPKILP